MKFNIKKLLLTGLIVIFAIGLGGCVSKNVDGLVAEVNGEEITQGEYDTQYEIQKRHFESLYGEGLLEQAGPDGVTFGESLRSKTLEVLIMEKIVEKDSSNLKVSVSDEEVTEIMDEYLEKLGGEEKLDAFLNSIKFTREYFAKYLRTELLFERHREKLIEDAAITDDSIKAYFEENKDNLVVIRASLILVDKEENAKEALDRLNNGEDFAKVAMDVSMHGSAPQGGDLGYISKGEYGANKEFEDVAFTLKKGETSRLVKTDVGYQIIHLVDRKDSYEDLKDDIMLVLKEEKYNDKMQELRDKAKVEKYMDTKAVK